MSVDTDPNIKLESMTFHEWYARNKQNIKHKDTCRLPRWKHLPIDECSCLCYAEAVYEGGVLEAFESVQHTIGLLTKEEEEKKTEET